MIPSFETVEIEGARSVVPGQTAIVRIGAGFTRIREHFILGGGLTLSDIESISIWLNGTQWRVLGSGAQLDLKNQYWKLPAYATHGILTVSHIREGARRFAESLITAVGMGSNPGGKAIENMEIRFKIASGASATSTITGFAQVTSPSAPGILLSETEDVFTYVTNGEQVIKDLVKEPVGEELDGLYMFTSGLSVDQLEVKVAGRQIFKRTAALNSHIIKSSVFRTPQSGLFTFDKSENGFAKEPLIVMSQDVFEVRPTVSGITGSGSLKVHKLITKRWV